VVARGDAVGLKNGARRDELRAAGAEDQEQRHGGDGGEHEV